MKFVLSSIRCAVTDEMQIVYFATTREVQGARLAIRISVNGRMICVHYAGKVLHDRSQRGQGGKRIRLPSVKVRRFRDVACAAVAFVAMGNAVERFPPQDFDL